MVIQLQAQFGNKWAKIATYLPGRTDNDVKNFWSTRRKRFERILQKSTSLQSQNNKGKSPLVRHELPEVKVVINVVKLSRQNVYRVCSIYNFLIFRFLLIHAVLLLRRAHHAATMKPTIAFQILKSSEWCPCQIW